MFSVLLGRDSLSELCSTCRVLHVSQTAQDFQIILLTNGPSFWSVFMVHSSSVVEEDNQKHLCGALWVLVSWDASKATAGLFLPDHGRKSSSHDQQ